jgi:hypothetical protein
MELLNNLEDIYVRDSLGNSIVEWRALAEYLFGLNNVLEKNVFVDRKNDSNSKIIWLFYVSNYLHSY